MITKQGYKFLGIGVGLAFLFSMFGKEGQTALTYGGHDHQHGQRGSGCGCGG